MKPRKMHNRIPVWVVLLLFAVLFLSACAGDGKTAAKRRDSKSGSLAATLTPTPSPTSTPSPTPTPMREPEDYDVAELYKAVDGIPNMYELPIAEYMKGREFEGLKVSGNYVLAYSFPRGSDGITDYMRPCCVLFHLGRPDLTRTYESSKKEQGYADWEVLSDGTVFKYDDEIGKVTVFDRELEKKNEFRYEGRIVSSSEKGLFWTYETNGTLSAFDTVTGEKAEEYSLQSLDFETVTELSDTVDGVRYFQGYNPDGVWMIVAVKQATGEADTVPMNHDNPTYLRDYVSYHTATQWFLQPHSTPNRMISFERGNKYEMLHEQKGSLLATSCSEFSEDSKIGDSAFAYMTVAVYDIGTRYRYACDVLKLTNEKGLNEINTFWFSDHGEAIFYHFGEHTGQNVYLWNYGAEDPESIPGYCEYEDTGIDTLVADRIAAIRDRFDIVVHYKKEQLSSNIFDYYMEPITDEVELISMIEEVWEFLAMYPDGFWSEIPGKEKEGIDFYICKEFVRRSTTMIENAAAVVNISWPTICMGVCSKYKNQMRETLVHETMHMMEQRLAEYAEEQDINPIGYWLEKLNTTKYPYHNAYTDSKGNSIEDPRGTYKGDKPSEAWFIDAYSRTFYKEDRARIIENLYLGNGYLFKNSQHLRDKAEFLCAMIRAAFPSVAASKEPVFWEAPLGIIDPEPYLDILRTY